jgi:RNA polymerase sigma-70 factor, ECF subfamily
MWRMAADSRDALTELVGRYQTPLLNYFTRLGVYRDQEDLVQETFIRLYKYRKRYRASARFNTFLYRIAHSVWVDHCRKLIRRERMMGYIRLDARIDEEVAAVVRKTPPDVDAVLAVLSPKLREVLILSVYQGLRQREIADILSIPLGTVKSRLHLAMQTVRETLDANTA